MQFGANIMFSAYRRVKVMKSEKAMEDLNTWLQMKKTAMQTDSQIKIAHAWRRWQVSTLLSFWLIIATVVES